MIIEFKEWQTGIKSTDDQGNDVWVEYQEPITFTDVQEIILTPHSAQIKHSDGWTTLQNIFLNPDIKKVTLTQEEKELITHESSTY